MPIKSSARSANIANLSKFILGAANIVQDFITKTFLTKMDLIFVNTRR